MIDNICVAKGYGAYFTQTLEEGLCLNQVACLCTPWCLFARTTITRLAICLAYGKECRTGKQKSRYQLKSNQAQLSGQTRTRTDWWWTGDGGGSRSNQVVGYYKMSHWAHIKMYTCKCSSYLFGDEVNLSFGFAVHFWPFAQISVDNNTSF